MRIRKGKAEYRAPKIGIMESADLLEDGIRYVLCQMPAQEFFKHRQKTHAHGRPLMFAIHGGKVHIAPIPNRGATMILRYYPPMVEA